MFVAVLEKDCTPHYFNEEINAQKYLIENSPEEDCNLDISLKLHSAELYNQGGISIGYYFQPKLEDVVVEEERKIHKRLLVEEKQFE